MQNAVDGWTYARRNLVMSTSIVNILSQLNVQRIGSDTGTAQFTLLYTHHYVTWPQQRQLIRLNNKTRQNRRGFSKVVNNTKATVPLG